NLPDPADRATQEEEFALELRTRDRERKLLKRINATLEKIDSGDYGYCDTCGIEIGLRRLEARPTAELCIDCKELAEIKEKQIAGSHRKCCSYQQHLPFTKEPPMQAYRLITVVTTGAFLLSPLLLSWWEESGHLWYRPYIIWLFIIVISAWVSIQRAPYDI